MDQPHQGELELNGALKATGGSGSRMWLLAGEEGELARLGSLVSGDAAYSHAFVDAGTGFPLMADRDLILVRTGR